MGTLETGAAGASDDDGAETAWPGGWRARWQAQQRGCLRFNCADSLDRTNAASYFCAVQARAAPCLPGRARCRALLGNTRVYRSGCESHSRPCHIFSYCTLVGCVSCANPH